jgi:hydrogenase maturation factor
MLAAVAPADVERFIAHLAAEGEQAAVIGELVERQGEAVTFDGSLKL